MVKSLYGKCQGQDIVFRLNEVGRWETAVPASPTGVYIIELWAEDYAGNVGYFATIEVTFDTSKLCMTVRILDVGAQFSVAEVKKILSGDGVSDKLAPDLIGWALSPDFLMSNVVRCEVCGR